MQLNTALSNGSGMSSVFFTPGTCCSWSLHLGGASETLVTMESKKGYQKDSFFGTHWKDRTDE